MVKPIPENYPRVSMSLSIDGAADAIGFYTSVLGASERMRLEEPGGKIAHAELEIGDSLLMIGDEHPEMGFLSPTSLGGTPVVLSVYVDDADAVFARAIEAGATPLREPADQFYGDRSGQFEDPWGHRWSVATHIEDLSADEINRRMADMAGGSG